MLCTITNINYLQKYGHEHQKLTNFDLIFQYSLLNMQIPLLSCSTIMIKTSMLYSITNINNLQKHGDEYKKLTNFDIFFQYSLLNMQIPLLSCPTIMIKKIHAMLHNQY